MATNVKKKTAHARGEGVKKRKQLEDTAKKLNLTSLVNILNERGKIKLEIQT